MAEAGPPCRDAPQFLYIYALPFVNRSKDGTEYDVPVEELDIWTELERLDEAIGVKDLKVTVKPGMRDTMVDWGNPAVRILHYSGHGERNGLAFEDDDGTMDFVRIEDLKKHPPSGHIKLAVVSACHSAKVAEEVFVNGLGIKHVVAVDHNQKLNDAAAATFLGQFYQGIIVNMNTVREAFDAATQHLRGKKGLLQEQAGYLKLLPEDEAHDERIFCHGELSTTGRRRDIPRRDREGDTRKLFGRHDSLQSAMEAVNRCFLHKNPRRMLEVVGEPGIGKSEFLTHLQNHLKLRYTSLGGKRLRVIRFSLNREEANRFTGSDEFYVIWQLANASSATGARAEDYENMSPCHVPVQLKSILGSDDPDLRTIIIIEGCDPFRDAVKALPRSELASMSNVFTIFEVDTTLDLGATIFTVELGRLNKDNAARLLFNQISSCTLQKEFTGNRFGLSSMSSKMGVLGHLKCDAVAVEMACGIPFLLANHLVERMLGMPASALVETYSFDWKQADAQVAVQGYLSECMPDCVGRRPLVGDALNTVVLGWIRKLLPVDQIYSPSQVSSNGVALVYMNQVGAWFQRYFKPWMVTLLTLGDEWVGALPVYGFLSHHTVREASREMKEACEREGPGQFLFRFSNSSPECITVMHCRWSANGPEIQDYRLEASHEDKGWELTVNNRGRRQRRFFDSLASWLSGNPTVTKPFYINHIVRVEDGPRTL